MNSIFTVPPPLLPLPHAAPSAATTKKTAMSLTMRLLLRKSLPSFLPSSNRSPWRLPRRCNHNVNAGESRRERQSARSALLYERRPTGGFAPGHVSGTTRLDDRPEALSSQRGAGGGIRTRMGLRPAPFEDATYTVPSPRRRRSVYGLLLPSGDAVERAAVEAVVRDDPGVEEVRVDGDVLDRLLRAREPVALPPVGPAGQLPAARGHLLRPRDGERGRVGVQVASGALAEAGDAAGGEDQRVAVREGHLADRAAGHVEHAEDPLAGHVVDDPGQLHDGLVAAVAVRVHRSHRPRIDLRDPPGGRPGRDPRGSGRTARQHRPDRP